MADETEGPERRIRSLLEARDASPSTARDTVMRLGGRGFLLFSPASSRTPRRYTA